MLGFQDKVAPVTGGGSGIGAALGQALLEEGAKVAFTDVDAARAETACGAAGKAGRAIGLRLDVTDPASWAAAIATVEQRLGPVDILCNNAGVVGSMTPLVEMPVEDLRWVFDVNVMGMVHGVRSVVPGVMLRGAGHVLHTVSIAGVDSIPGHAEYSASKHAALALSEVLRDELARTGIGVSALCPGAVETAIMQTSRDLRLAGLAAPAEAASPVSEAARAAAIEASGGRMSPAEVARLALAGMKRGQLYIFTHVPSEQRVRARMHEMLQAYALLRERAAGAAA